MKPEYYYSIYLFTMPRFFIEKKNIFNDSIIIKGDHAKYIGRVLRLGVNDQLCLFDQEGNIFDGVIAFKSNREISVRIIARKMAVNRDAGSIILGQAVPKGKKMDFIVQKSTELGVSAIIPFFSSRSIPKWDQIKAENKRRHWQRIIAASLQQSGIRPAPTIKPIIDFSDLVKGDFRQYFKIIFWEDEAKQELKSVLAARQTLKNIIFLVGPEGGFSNREIELAKTSGFLAVGLGAGILRTETVSLTVLSIIQYEKGYFNSSGEDLR